MVAGCDIDSNMAASFAATQKFDLTDDYKTLLKRADVDAIAVVTPHLLHEEMAVAGLKAGKQVFCEKPLALTTEQLLGNIRILDAVTRSAAADEKPVTP